MEKGVNWSHHSANQGLCDKGKAMKSCRHKEEGTSAAFNGRENNWLPVCFPILLFPVSRLLSIPGTPQPCLISVQPNWIKDGPLDLCPKYLFLQCMENQKHGSQKQSCHWSNGEQEWSQRKQMLMMQDTLHNSFVKATCRAGSQHYKTCEKGPLQMKATTTVPCRIHLH